VGSGEFPLHHSFETDPGCRLTSFAVGAVGELYLYKKVSILLPFYITYVIIRFFKHEIEFKY
jgi:hypothetical protein